MKKMFSRGIKISPVVNGSLEIRVDSHVVIQNEDDDMNGVTGIFKGHFINDRNEYRSLIVLDENNRNFYTAPETVFLIENKG